MKTVPVATFNERGPALRLQQRFHDVGIQAEITDESRIERYWFLSKPLAAIHVEVQRPAYLNARRLIEEWDRSEGVLTEAVRCPECHSSRIQYPQMTRKFVTPSVGVVLMLLRLVPREFYCLDCQFTWPGKPKGEEPERDILGWPVHKRGV